MNIYVVRVCGCLITGISNASGISSRFTQSVHRSAHLREEIHLPPLIYAG
jgi:hypothetical protein